MDMGLAGKVALVTGARGGIGRAIALAMAGEGAHIALLSRKLSEALEVASRIEAEHPGSRVLALEGDIAREGDAERFAAATYEHFGRIDALVNCAGGAMRGRLEEIPPEAWMEYLQVKPLGLIRCTRAVVPYLRRSGGGKIVNVAGLHGKEPSAWTVMGGAINASVLAFSKALADDLAADGITVNVVSPGHTATGRWRELVGFISNRRGLGPAEAEEFLMQRIPLRRLVQPEEVAAAVVFLASRWAATITGACIVVDGGRSRSI